ncbi:MAG: kynureninase [Polyangiaceae bacterium]
MKPADLFRAPNALAPHYTRFGVEKRILLTGHSHQAWPDCGLAGQIEAWSDAAELADEKWDRAFAKAARVQAGFAALLGDREGSYPLSSHTHELHVRGLSALDLRARPRIVSTDGEFHSARRQLDRLAEERIEVVRVAHRPTADVAGRLAAAIDDRTAAVIVSAVFFTNAHIAPNLRAVMEACERTGTELLVDVYHALNVVPFSLAEQGLGRAYVVGGGYKYCQLGEGNCFLRSPAGTTLRPVVTGWYSEFDALAEAAGSGRVPYGQGGGRFAGSTYDPTSHYRAAKVFDFFESEGLTPAFLREVSQHQVGRLAAGFDALGADPRVIRRDRGYSLEGVGGFLALEAPRAGDICGELRQRGVLADSRGEVLRLGPAPYLTDDQLDSGIGALREVLASLF